MPCCALFLLLRAGEGGGEAEEGCFLLAFASARVHARLLLRKNYYYHSVLVDKSLCNNKMKECFIPNLLHEI